jgi:hypothetical protein
LNPQRRLDGFLRQEEVMRAQDPHSKSLVCAHLPLSEAS